MKKINYIKKIEDKIKIINDIKDTYSHIVYILPKKFYKELEMYIKDFDVFFYEDLAKSNVSINIARPESVLILDSCSRYKNISTTTYSRISKLARTYKNKMIIDAIPFSSNIEFLYLPLSYINREILGYQHYYAFRENNSEVFNGEIIESHDLSLNAKKLAPYTYMTYNSFLDNINLYIHEVELTKEEYRGYEDVKEICFKKFNQFNPIVTRLCDYSNMCVSVYNEIDKIINQLSGSTILYTNIKSHNPIFKKKYKNIEIRTFYDANGDEHLFDNFILCEIPIVKSYLFMDIISRMKKNATVYIIKPKTPAIKLVYNRMNTEYTQLESFTKELRKEIDLIEKRG